MYSGEPVKFFERATGCCGWDYVAGRKAGFTKEPQRAKWQGHEFLLFGVRGGGPGGPVHFHRLKLEKASGLGKMLASLLD